MHIGLFCVKQLTLLSFLHPGAGVALYSAGAEFVRQNWLPEWVGGLGWWNGLVEWVGGMGWWNGFAEWVGGMGWWNGLAEWVGGMGWWNGLVYILYDY